MTKLSLCIPTNGNVKWVIPVLDSIYRQDFNRDDVEVIVCDNGADSTLEEHIPEDYKQHLQYYKTNDKGFLNTTSCLKRGNGTLIRMINHRSVMCDGSIKNWIELIDKYSERKPIIYFSDSVLKNNSFIECSTMDKFVRELAVFCSWSAGISIWKEDLPIMDKIEYNEMFPNASLLLNDYYKEREYLIDDRKYQDMQDETGKGGYDLYHTFAVVFLDILTSLRVKKLISEETFLYVKDGIYKFVCSWYLKLKIEPNKYTFKEGDIKKSISIYFTDAAYYKMIIKANIRIPLHYIKKTIKGLLGR